MRKDDEEKMKSKINSSIYFWYIPFKSSSSALSLLLLPYSIARDALNAVSAIDSVEESLRLPSLAGL